MRKQEKYIVNGGLIVAGVAVVVDLCLQSADLKKRGLKVNWQNVDCFRAFKVGVGGAVIGCLAGNEIYKMSRQRESLVQFTPNTFLKSVLKGQNIKSDPITNHEVLQLTREVKNTLNGILAEDLVCYPESVGSLEKGTALASGYDSDVIVALRRKNRYSTLANMSNSVHSIIEQNFASRATVSKKRRATTIVFEGTNRDISIDVVYGREIGNYKLENELNIHMRPKSFWSDSTYSKTNVAVQKDLLLEKPRVREVIMLVKQYLRMNNTEMDSALLDQLVLDALSSKGFGTSSSVSVNFSNGLRYIAAKLTSRNVVDYANSNNNLLDKIDSEKNSIRFMIDQDLAQMANCPHYLKEIFHY